MRIATVHNVRALQFGISAVEGTGSISPRARRVLGAYIPLVKQGFDALSAPMGAIADAVFRISWGESRSIRTVQRAHSELIQAGFISFRQCRNAGVMILFNLPAFAFWTRTKTKNVSPLPTQSHNVVSRETTCDTVPHTTTCHPSDRTRIESHVNSPTISQSSNNSPRAGARDQKSFSKRRADIVLSLRCVLKKMDMHPSERRRIVRKLKYELAALQAGIPAAQSSGIDLDYWRKRWDEMPITVRESTIRREFLPALLDRPSAPSILGSSSTDAPSSEKLAAIVAELSRAAKASPASAPSSSSAPQTNSLDADETRFLLSLDLRAERRRVNSR